MEILDFVDKNDNVIGATTRDGIYKKNLIHRIVHVMIFNNEGKIALQLRSNKVSYCPNHRSTTVGGHVQTGESYEEAALREYNEELWTESKIEKISKDYYEIEWDISKFLVTFKTIFNGPFYPDGKEVEKIDFFTIEEIEKMIKNGEKFHPELLFLLNKYFL